MIGRLPTWAWILLGGAALLIFLRYRGLGTPQGAGSSNGLPSPLDDSAGAGGGGGGGGGGGEVPSGFAAQPLIAASSPALGASVPASTYYEPLSGQYVYYLGPTPGAVYGSSHPSTYPGAPAPTAPSWWSNLGNWGTK